MGLRSAEEKTAVIVKGAKRAGNTDFMTVFRKRTECESIWTFIQEWNHITRYIESSAGTVDHRFLRMDFHPVNPLRVAMITVSRAFDFDEERHRLGRE